MNIVKLTPYTFGEIERKNTLSWETEDMCSRSDSVTNLLSGLHEEYDLSGLQCPYQ